MSEICPFCRNNVNPGASVCSHCGAFKSSPAAQHGNVGCGLLCLWGVYGLVVFGLFGDKHAGFSDDLAAGVFAVIGFLVLFSISKYAGRSIWYRRN